MNITEKEYNNMMEENIRICDKDPKQFIPLFLLQIYWRMQGQIIDSVFTNLRTSVKSCNASGKSWLASACAHSFIHRYENSIVITTAPTLNQVDNVIWREMRGMYEPVDFILGGTMLKRRYELSPNHYAIGFSTKDPEKARGWHSKSGKMLIIVDEANGMQDPILEALQGNATSNDVHILYIGNPVIPRGNFYDTFRSKLWHNFSISVFDTPNFTANNIRGVEDLMKFKTEQELLDLDHPYPMLVTPLWAWGRMHDWGVDNPLFQSLVQAIFPSQGINSLISLSDVEKCKKESGDIYNGTKCVAVDVARYGDDNTVLTPIVKHEQSHRFKQIEGESYTGKDTMKTVGRAINMFQEIGGIKELDFFAIDDDGVGGGVTDRLIELEYNVVRIQGGAKPMDDKYFNARSEMYHTVADIMKEGRVEIEDWGDLSYELTNILYSFHSDGRKKIISKDDLKKIIKQSPDFSDSLALGLYGMLLYTRDTYKDRGGNSEESHTISGNIHNKTF